MREVEPDPSLAGLFRVAANFSPGFLGHVCLVGFIEKLSGPCVVDLYRDRGGSVEDGVLSELLKPHQLRFEAISNCDPNGGVGCPGWNGCWWGERWIHHGKWVNTDWIWDIQRRPGCACVKIGYATCPMPNC